MVGAPTRPEETEEESITLEEFLATCRAEVEVPATEGTIREVTAATPGVTFRRFRTPARDLLSRRLYAASDLDVDATRWILPGEEVPLDRRCMVTYADLVGRPRLLRESLERMEAERAGRPRRPHPRAMLLTCTGCAGSWLFDGNHELTRLAVSGEDAVVTVTEMSAPRFPMRACRCAEGEVPDASLDGRP